MKITRGAALRGRKKPAVEGRLFLSFTGISRMKRFNTGMPLRAPYRLLLRPLALVPSPRFVVWAATALVAAAGLYRLYDGLFPTLTYRAEAAAVHTGSAYLSGGAPAPAPPLMREMTVANNGMIYIRNASVNSVQGSTIIASIAWGRQLFVWTIHTDGSTRFIGDSGEAGALKDIGAGAAITVSGSLDVGEGGQAIEAQYVRY